MAGSCIPGELRLDIQIALNHAIGLGKMEIGRMSSQIEFADEERQRILGVSILNTREDIRRWEEVHELINKLPDCEN